MSVQHKRVKDEPNVIGVELLATDEDENWSWDYLKIRFGLSGKTL